jgi:hypothetical protein
MLKLLFCSAISISLAGAASAQQAGSTYPVGSNLPQRTAGEIGPKTTGQMGGSASPTSSHKVQKKHARRKGAVPSGASKRGPKKPPHSSE